MVIKARLRAEHSKSSIDGEPVLQVLGHWRACRAAWPRRWFHAGNLVQVGGLPG